MNTKEIKRLIRSKYAWPGGYEICLIASDGELLCTKCARENYAQIAWSARSGVRDSWKVVGHMLDCDLEGTSNCAHCNKTFADWLQVD